MARCTTHRSAVAGWHCALCASELCGACAALTENQVVVCATCGSLAATHRAPRAEVHPFATVWPAALRELRAPAGIFQVFVVATVAHACFTWGRSMWVVGCVLTVTWVLNLARRAGVGIGAFALPTWEDLRIVALGALPRFTCAAGLLGLGAMAWTRLGLVARPLGSPWPWGLAVAALIIVPPALAVSTIQGHSPIAWPWRLPFWLRTLGPDLRPLQLAMLMFVVFELFESRLPPINRELEDTLMLEHLVQTWIPRLLSFTGLGALGSLAGLLVFTRAGQLEHRRPDDDLVPRLTAPPTGRYLPPARDVEAQQEERARKFAPIALDESPALSAIERGAKEEAIAGYRSGEIRVGQLELGLAVTLAQWLAGTGDFSGAASLLRVVTGRVGGDEGALAKALVVLARLCAERLGAQTEALRVYEEVVRRFPDSSAAKFAAEQLAALR